jgi:uncharacterized membrane protein
MTTKELIKLLEKIDKKAPRCTVVVDWQSFDSCDEYSHVPVASAKVQNIRWAVDDKFELADGSERTKNVVVLSGYGLPSVL